MKKSKKFLLKYVWNEIYNKSNGVLNNRTNFKQLALKLLKAII